MKELILIVAGICIAGSGCRDNYGEAMKRLLAEQKQLDWLDGKIKEIEREAKELDESYDREMREIANEKHDYISEAVDTAVMKVTEARMKRITDRSIRDINRLADAKKPWLEKRRAQLKVVERAEKAVEDAR